MTPETYGQIRGLASRISRQRYVEWDDLTQEIVTRMLEHEDNTGLTIAEPLAWAWIIGRNIAASVQRREIQIVTRGLVPGDEEDEGYDNDPTATAALNDRQVNELLADMSEIQRAVIVAQAEGRSRRETSEVLGISEHEVKYHRQIVRAKAAASV